MSIINLKHEDEHLSKLLHDYSAIYDTETQEVTLTCICDGTGAFLEQMRWLLREIGCYNIRWGEDVSKKYGTEEKPWCNCKYTACGKLSKGNVHIKNSKEKEHEPHKVVNRLGELIWINDMFIRSFKQFVNPCGTCPYKDKCEYTTLTPDLRGESCQYYSLAERFGADDK